MLNNKKKAIKSIYFQHFNDLLIAVLLMRTKENICLCRSLQYVIISKCVEYIEEEFPQSPLTYIWLYRKLNTILT
jgi:hypothetical protein